MKIIGLVPTDIRADIVEILIKIRIKIETILSIEMTTLIPGTI